MTETVPRPRRRSNSISEYSQIFSQTAPKPSTFIGQRRHPSLSMNHDRSTSFGKLGVGVPSLTGTLSGSAIDDSDAGASANLTNAAKPEDPVGLGRRLSQGARAIMYNGNRLRGESINSSSERPRQSRTYSNESGASSTAKSPVIGPYVAEQEFVAQNPADVAKQIKRRMSPTGERMLRGELAFH